jgi:putative drug exporter of the RND superfamily
VRMTLVPALLTLLRERSWYLPRWLDRLLPNLTIEPPHENGPAPAQTAAHAASTGRRAGGDLHSSAQRRGSR